jgi:hypothetical protein
MVRRADARRRYSLVFKERPLLQVAESAVLPMAVQDQASTIPVNGCLRVEGMSQLVE